MATGKKSVLLYVDWISTFDKLSDEEAGKLIKHFFRYVNDMHPVAPDRITELLFEPIRQTLKRDLVKYEEKSKKNSANALIRWNKNNANACERINNDAKNADSDIDSDSDIDKDNSISVKQKRFTPPTIEEVKTYCQERNNNVDFNKWFNFYQSKNWMIGKNKMKDWKAAVRTWENSNKNGNIGKNAGEISRNDEPALRDYSRTEW